MKEARMTRRSLRTLLVGALTISLGASTMSAANAAPTVSREQTLFTASPATEAGSTTSGLGSVAETKALPLLWLGAIAVRMSAHAIRQAAARGVSQQLIKQTIQNGKRTRGNNGTWVYTQGKGKDRVRVIVNEETGKVVTVTKG